MTRWADIDQTAAIALAVQHHQEISGSPLRWADLYIAREPSGMIDITMNIGPRRPDGTKEYQLVTRRYYVAEPNGNPVFITYAHP